MKIIRSKPTKLGKIHLTVELDQNEEIEAYRPDFENLLRIDKNSFFKLGYPNNDLIVPSHELENAEEVHWDSISQKWEKT